MSNEKCQMVACYPFITDPILQLTFGFLGDWRIRIYLDAKDFSFVFKAGFFTHSGAMCGNAQRRRRMKRQAGGYIL
ncbi:hypothetical protein [Desulfosarcina ovata]|uniref:hypothetical protein n=1 Tax=Desulfosarcina ovata TaxID=83564 RepID=UPI0012D31EAE|nr:hypothetical protein [Desulfosarcina ovata]